MVKSIYRKAVLWACLSLFTCVAAAAEQGVTTLDAEVELLKQEVIKLNRDLFLLEEELLFPASTQTTFFVSMGQGLFFALDAVKLVVDGETVAHHLYTDREVEALARGGVQRLHIGNLRAGEHEVVVFFTGQGSAERDYRRGVSHKFEKGFEPKYIEFKISDSTKKNQPEFSVKEWE